MCILQALYLEKKNNEYATPDENKGAMKYLVLVS